MDEEQWAREGPGDGLRRLGGTHAVSSVGDPRLVGRLGDAVLQGKRWGSGTGGGGPF